MNETFGDWLKALRKKIGFSQQELADRSGVTKSTISLLEKNKIEQPRISGLERIAKALNISPEEMRRALVEKKLSTTGSTFSKPTNIVEFLNALESLGIEQFQFRADIEQLENYSEDEYQELLERIQSDISITLKRSNRGK